MIIEWVTMFSAYIFNVLYLKNCNKQILGSKYTLVCNYSLNIVTSVSPHTADHYQKFNTYHLINDTKLFILHYKFFSTKNYVKIMKIF